MNTTMVCRILSIVFVLTSTTYAQIIYVDSSVSDQPNTYRSIQEALDSAKAGDQIIIKKGIYGENLVVKCPISLQGEPDQTVTITGNPNADNKTLCTVNNIDNCTLENLVFIPSYQASITSVGISLNGGRVQIKKCKFEKATSATISCSGGCQATVDECLFQDAGRSGIWVSMGQTFIKANNCHFSNNKECGVYFYDGACGEISKCTFEKNTKAGVMTVGQDVNISINDSQFTNNIGYGGAYITSKSSAKIQNCEFISNQQGISGNKAQSMMLTNNQVKQNKEHGIYLYEVETSNLNQNTCENNGYNGIYIQQGKESILSENKSIQNKRNGFSFMGKTLMIEATKNYAQENNWQGLFAGDGVLGTLIQNESVLNTLHGIYAANSDVSLVENRCKGNQYSGICLEEGSMGLVQKNICQDNQSYGIAVADPFAIPTCEENKCEGNIKGIMYLENPSFGQVREMLFKGEFEKLDSIVAKLIQEESRNDEGTWQLGLFHSYLIDSWSGRSAENKQKLITAVEKWIAQNPKSQTPVAVLAGIYCMMGWDARGTGTANTVTAEGWKALNDYLNKGLALLDKADDRELKDPEFYIKKMVIGIGLGKDKIWMQDAMNKGLAIKNNYHELYKQMAEYLLPKWYGSSKEVRAFAESTIQPELKDRSHLLYIFIVKGIWGCESDTGFMELGFDYKNMKQGFEQLLSVYPDAIRNANRFCVVACINKDKETARKLFQKIGDDIMLEVWKNDKEYLNQCKAWALSEDKSTGK